MTHYSISSFMSASPVTVERGQPLDRAHSLMAAHGVRHLPVLEGGKLVGLISERELQLVENILDLSRTNVPVEDAMSPDPFFVSPDASLAEVVQTMAERRFGSVVVVDRGQVVGVFTAVDALQALACILNHGPSLPD